MPVIGGDTNCEIPNLLVPYITVHYRAMFPVRLHTMYCYISRKALKAVSVSLI